MSDPGAIHSGEEPRGRPSPATGATGRTQEDARASEERFRIMVESVKDYAIFMLDVDGRIATWNAGAERIKGYVASEVIGQSLTRFYTPEDLARGKPQLLLQAAVRDGRVEDEGWRVRKDGTRFWADVVITAVRDASGTLRGFAKVTRDLTDRRDLEQQRLQLARAQEAIRLRDEFLSIASHELKTPLTVLQLQLDGLRERMGSLDPATASKVERAARNGERLVALVETLLDVSRITSGKFDLNRMPFDLGALAREVVDGLREAAAAAGCELRLEAPEVVAGTWDRLRVEQILTNLVVNAIKYGAGAPVTVAVARQGDSGVLEVRDRGPGIPEAELPRLFARFERAASTRHYGGLGLGLYLTRQIAAAHGGTVSACNAPAGGARFTVVLPLDGRAAAEEPALATAEPG